MPYRVDTMMNPVKPSPACTELDGAARDAQVNQLPVPNQPVLSTRQLSQNPIHASPHGPSRAFATDIVGNASLVRSCGLSAVRHWPMVDGDGARVARWM